MNLFQTNQFKVSQKCSVPQNSLTKISKLWKDVENLSCYHTQKGLLDAPTFVTVTTVRHSLPLVCFETETKVGVSSSKFCVW